MESVNVEKDINNFIENFAEEIEAIDIISILNQIVEYSKKQNYSKEGTAGAIINGWMAGFMAGYRKGKQANSDT